MLPNIHSEDGSFTVHPWVLGIRGFGHLKLARAVSGQPSPSGTELSGTSCLECVLESIKRTEIAFDSIAEGSGRHSTLVGTHRLPEEGVVDHLGGVIEFRGGLTAVPGLEHDLLDGELIEIGALDLTIEVVHIGGMMLAVVELESGLHRE